MIRVQLESPWAVPMSPQEREAFPEHHAVWALMHAEYLRHALRDSLLRCEAPFASHGLYVAALDDDIEAERALGIGAGLAFLRNAERQVFYMDLVVREESEEGEERLNLDHYRTHELTSEDLRHLRYKGFTLSRGMQLAGRAAANMLWERGRELPREERRLGVEWTRRSLDMFCELHRLREAGPARES